MWVKLCGIRDVETALVAAEVGADAIGLNFYAKSPRCVSVAVAAEIVASLPQQTAAVGLFVNHSLDEILRTLDAVPVAAVQLHGDESPADIAAVLQAWPETRIIRAHRFGGSLEPLRQELEELAALDAMPTAILVDAAVPGEFGGTGHRIPWAALAESWDETEFPPLILAGGLLPENVGEAIATVRPWGVDTASGVESSRAVKDPELMRAFVAAAKSADFS